jgi:hypothetical protein
MNIYTRLIQSVYVWIFIPKRMCRYEYPYLNELCMYEYSYKNEMCRYEYSHRSYLIIFTQVFILFYSLGYYFILFMKDELILYVIQLIK